MLAALRRVRGRTALVEFILPFAARQQIAATGISSLDSLNEATPLLPDAKTQPSALQRQVGGVVIGADQPRIRAGRCRSHFDERSPQLGQVGWRSGELEFDLCRHQPPPVAAYRGGRPVAAPSRYPISCAGLFGKSRS